MSKSVSPSTGAPRTTAYIREAAEVWAPTYPRQVGRYQTSAESLDEVVEAMTSVHGSDAGFISVYSFPRGHSTDGNIPRVDTLMLDFDVQCEVYNKDGNRVTWRLEMDAMLAAVRRLVSHLIEEDQDKHWRFSLSGHKGVHLYLDFNAIHPAHGNLYQFKTGLGEYTEKLIDYLEEATDTKLRTWLDVDSSDMGRLTRLPNTLHSGATQAFGEDRYCVPVTADELANLDPEGYEELVSRPRRLPEEIRRVPSERATTRIATHVHSAHGGSSSNSTQSLGNLDRSKIKRVIRGYDNDEAKSAYTSVDDIWLFTDDKPCIRAFYERDDQFKYGNQSHVMELFVLTRLVNLGVPSEVILSFFEGMDGYDEWTTKERLAQVIARNYADFNCEKIWLDAPRFCIENRCDIYQRSH